MMLGANLETRGGHRMEFGSDNVVGASAPIVEAIAVAARAGREGTYGSDRWTQSAVRRLEDLFERKLSVLLMTTGTAANALSLATVTPPWGGVFCHDMAHINDEECGAPEFFTAGGKLIGVAGPGGKMTARALTETLARFPRGGTRHVHAATLSLSQATESGTAYACEEIGALAEVARGAGLSVHMDGARFANALVDLRCTPAEMTWKAGVDILSFGATKNGALACEAIIAFDPGKAEILEIQRKRAGHTLSKGRFLGAQMDAYLADDHWLDLARHANRMAKRLADGLIEIAGIRLPWSRQANEVFAVLPGDIDAALKQAGAHYYEWDALGLSTDDVPRAGEVFIRLVCSFETLEQEVDDFIRIAGGAR
ncbi:threonine aldolase family protein [Lichenihabitans psoromatis]|uniref:threonine aldolase family protein n=1 Tax=Lichenihabitans psoromatis TaxID=2528642 RepID=UPI00315C8267